MFWLKYKRRTSASEGHWEWMMLSNDTLEVAKRDADTYIHKMDDSYYWSEHHRGFDYEVVTEAPRWIVDNELNSMRSLIANAQFKLIRLESEIENSKECGCAGKHDHSCYCMHCGKTLKRKDL